MNRRNEFWLVALLLGIIPGCQSWQSGAYPFTNTARVPAPGTGSYQVPSSYYNNTGGQVSQVQQGTDPNATVTASAQTAPTAAMPGPAMPAASTAALPVGTSQPVGGNVQPAGFAPPPTTSSGTSTFTPSAPPPSGIADPAARGFPPPAGGSVNSTFSDSTEAPSLQWQP